MPSMRSTFCSIAASRASVSRLPSPQSTRSRVRSVSSKVMLPELPDAKMETRKPIGRSSQEPKKPQRKCSAPPQTTFQNDGRANQTRQSEKAQEDLAEEGSGPAASTMAVPQPSYSQSNLSANRMNVVTFSWV